MVAAHCAPALLPGEVKRLLAVLEKQLEGRDYIIGSEYTLADVATFPWVNVLSSEAGFNAADALGLDALKNVNAWAARCGARPAVQAGLNVTPFT
ncbi:putative GST-like protein yghU [Monoraphidium neglectum]|uniref:Putative GST-like protein yghU n=1 Tax=Monoraphidium neglectum TaxID=145388 RepID=A0A0D2LNB0_9CHLO|nr:putative GST-like protein yghU [Monoraphidium neglectum]KIY93284.1 putative GST-like protein yghU [Monoraphidium neglectum]|eukprot:XP_013892304.1 putative GST-like protein yghU [Monoraphidium neglectum]